MLDPVTLDQLRVLAAVATDGSFSAAARRLRRAQSAVSQAIRGLEDNLGIRVFDRSGKYPSLTPAGTAILSDARKLISDMEALKARARSMAEGLEAELAIAVDPLFPTGSFLAALRDVQARYPSLPLRIVTAQLATPARLLREGAVAIAIYATETSDLNDLVPTFLADVEMVPVVAATHPLAHEPAPVAPDALGGHVQLVLSDGQSNGWSRGVVGPKIWRFAETQIRLEFLIGGFGWCNMPRHVVAPELKNGRLVELDIRNRAAFRITVEAVSVRGYSPGPGARLLLKSLRERLGEIS